MKKKRIKGSVKKGGDWAVFKTNQNIGLDQPITFKNIDDAYRSPLVQKLFYLPFVKSVRLAKRQIEIERFNVLEWEEVLEEVEQQIEGYLNDGGIVMTQKRSEKIPVTVYAESTPNPAVMKFVANKTLVNRSFEFKNINEAKNSPLGMELFHFPFVKEVFLDANYISITKFGAVSWDEAVMKLREFIRSWLESGNSVVDEAKIDAITSNLEGGENLDETELQIVNILEEYIKPAVASDGGNIVFESYDPATKLVRVTLQGACSGCPSSTLTLKNGIETMLKEMMSGKVENVEGING